MRVFLSDLSLIQEPSLPCYPPVDSSADEAAGSSSTFAGSAQSETAGNGEYRELTITAQLNLTFTLDGRMVSIPTFVQPDSEQECLLGVNALELSLPLLGSQHDQGQC